MKNVGDIDRIIRLVLGIVLIAVLIFVNSGIRWIGLLGFVLIGTAIIRVCPLYMPFHINTKK